MVPRPIKIVRRMGIYLPVEYTSGRLETIFVDRFKISSTLVRFLPVLSVLFVEDEFSRICVRKPSVGLE